MATRSFAHPNLLPNISCFIRRLNTLPTPISTVSNLSLPEKVADKDKISTVSSSLNFPEKVVDSRTADNKDKIIKFDDLEGLFDKVTTPKLIKSSLILQMAANEPLVDMGSWLMNSSLIRTPILKEMILAGIKHSFFEHFVAGEDLDEAGRAVVRLSKAGLRGMLDYGLEHADDNQSCDRNLEEFIKTIELTKSLPPSSVSFVVVKITAVCPPSLLKRVSDLLRWEYKDTTFSLPWKHKTLPIFSDSSPLYHTSKQPHPLTPEEEQNLQLSHQRFFKICEKCIEANVPLLVDAEETTLQPAIDYLTYSSCIVYHRGDNNPLVFGTIQAYMKDAKERLAITKKAADKMGVPIGFKLVRGAYMSFEKQVADSLGVESPIHDTKAETHESYNSCAAFMLDEVAKGPGQVVLATHNVESGKLAAAKAVDLGIRKEDGKLEFAQLYGMADTLTFSLRNAGMQVSKYLPFGPVDQIVPYLLRRAEENRGVLSASYLDNKLMRKEISRRLNQFFYSLIRKGD